MSADPINLHPAFYNNVLPYQHPNFWLNFAQPGYRLSDVSMTSQQHSGCYIPSHGMNDALLVYDARDSMARCVKIPTHGGAEEVVYDPGRLSGVSLQSEYQLFGISNPLDAYASSLRNHVTSTITNSHTADPTQSVVMPKPLHCVPTTRQQHYHQRHHAHAKHPQANNLKNKTRFSATGVSPSSTIVRDIKMSLSSAPSSPSAGSVGGSLGNYHLFNHPHITSSNAFCVPQYKGSSSSSSSSSCCSTTGLKISSSSHSSYSSRSSTSSTPSLSGISPRKRRADDVINSNRDVCCRKGYPQRTSEGEMGLCSCEACATDEVTARVDDVTIRDVRTEEHGQQQKRSKNDDDVVFVSAEPGPGIRQPKERPVRKKKHVKKAAYRQVTPIEQHQVQPFVGFPFVVPTPSPPTLVESKDVASRYFLRSVAKGRKQDESVSAGAPQPANCLPQSKHISSSVQSVVTPAALGAAIDGNNNALTKDFASTIPQNIEKASAAPRYHTRSHQKKANAEQLKPKVQPDALANAQLEPEQTRNHEALAASERTENCQQASVIQAAVPPTSCSKQIHVPTSNQAQSSAEAGKETPRSSSSLKKLYDIHGIIGVGGGGTVYAGTRKSDGMQVAIKQVPKAKVKRWGKLSGRTVPIEFELLYRASHSGHIGVIRMLDWYERRSTYILVMERPQPVIDLFDYLNQYGALPEASARSIFRQIAEAVIHCHAKGVVHRDIKDENIILNLHTSEAKLIDFGCGTVLKSTPYTEFAGTPEFYPPEWFTHRRYYGQRVDAWSLGVLLFTMVEAEVPFQKEKDIVECNLRHKRAAHLSDSCKNLIAWMLQKDQDMRPTIEQALSHPWFRENEAPLRVTPPVQQPAPATGVMGTNELYEKRLIHHQNGINATGVKGVKNHQGHEVASTESPESPPRYTEALLYQTQSACQAAHQNGGLYQTACVAR